MATESVTLSLTYDGRAGLSDGQRVDPQVGEGNPSWALFGISQILKRGREPARPASTRTRRHRARSRRGLPAVFTFGTD